MSDSEDESVGKSTQLVDISAIMEKYFNNNDQLAYVMEKMVSDLSAKVVEERQKNANRARGEVTSGSGNETLPGHFVEQTLAGINTTLEQDKVLDTRFGLKRESKKMIKRVEQETSDLSLQLNKLLTKATQKKMELERLESTYRNTESKMTLLIASLSVIEEKKKKVYARRDSMEEKSNKIAAYQRTLEYMLKREAVLTVESKKRSLAISQKIKAVRRHYNSLYELGLEASNMKNETKLQLQTLREKSAKQINKLNVELEKDTGMKNMLMTLQENLARRKERRKLISAGLEFDELHDKIRSNKLQKNSEAVASTFTENPSNVQIQYGNRFFKYKELEKILQKLYKVHNFSTGEASPEAWLIDIYKQEQQSAELKNAIDKNEITIKSKREELERLKQSENCAKAHDRKLWAQWRCDENI